MSRPARKEVFAEDEVGIYHCVNRCVRRAYLCGKDPVTGKSFDHRKAWIRERLRELAAIFAFDVLDYAVLSNHFHVILRNRPDLVATWSDEAVARRWWRLYPQRRDENGQPAEPEEHELQAMLADPDRIRQLRQRLSHISWFMRCLSEHIARRANREDDTTGRFWAGRFKCTRLLDLAALLVCSIYVCLNVIRAGLAETPETSRYTSAYDRIQSLQTRRPEPQHRGGHGDAGGGDPGAADAWLSPVRLVETGVETPTRLSSRASDRGYLPMDLTDYLNLLDWTGRQVRRDKPAGSIPPGLAPILERLQIVPESWTGAVQQFGRWFPTAAGTSTSLAAEAARRDRQWLRGIGRSRQVFA